MNKLTQLHELAGKTLRGVWHSRYGHDLVLIFDDNDWCVIEGEQIDAGEIGAGLNTYGERLNDIKIYLSPEQLLEADLLTSAQFEHLKAEESRRLAERNRAHAAELLAEADRLMTTEAA